MTNDAPRQAALQTTEILENILSYLPNRNFFGVQRVCRQWKDVIAGSPTIQDKLFLKLRDETPETWILTNPVSFEYIYDHDNFDIRTVKKKFRIASAAQVKSRDKTSFGQVPLFMPVTLNPLLERWNVTGLWIEEHPVEHAAIFSAEAHLTQFAQHGSARATFITDPPCNEVKVMLHYNPRPSRPGFYFLAGHVKFRSDRPLTVGDAIDKALESRIMWWRQTYRHTSTDVLGDLTAAQKIDELEKEHSCKLVLSCVSITLALNDTKIQPLPLTDAEYLRYKPTRRRPAGDDNSEESSSGSDSSEDSSTEDDATEGEQG